MVEKFSPAASDPPLGDSVLPWRLNTRAFRLYMQRALSIES
jgi:hypothetical protein